MSNRAAILFDDEADGPGALLGALTQIHHLTNVRSSMDRPGGAGRGRPRAWWLATYRPDLVIASAKGPDALLAALYRLLFPRSRLLVRLRGPSRSGGVRERLLRSILLSLADAVLTDDTVAGAARPARWTAAPRPGTPVFPLSGPPDLEPFLACPLIRAPGSVHRVAYVGPLSPGSGATDILQCIAGWARLHNDHPTEVWWIGEGDLVGILDAQPLPEGMSQRFLGPLDRTALAGCFAQCGILVLPTGQDAAMTDPEPPVAEALAAGLVVVGSRRNAQVRRLVEDGVTGWTFDPARLDQFALAISRALGGVSDDLAAMRAEARQRIRRMVAQTDTERLHAAFSALLPVPAPAQRPQGMAVLHHGPAGHEAPGIR